MKKVLISGANGFIGTSIIDALSSMYELILTDVSPSLFESNPENKFNFIQCDICDLDNFSLPEEIDVILHLAAISSLPQCQANPKEAFRVNVMGTANVLEIARRYPAAHVIFASTSAVYENNSKYPFKETDSVTPTLVYSQTKLTAEKLINSYIENYALNATILRFFNVYGAKQNKTRKNPPLMGYISKCIEEGINPIFYSSGDQKRDYVHVDDITRAIRIIIEKRDTFGEVFNICSGKTYSVREIFNLFLEFSEKEIRAIWADPQKFWNSYPEIVSGPHPMHPDRIQGEVEKFSVGDNKKIRKMLGWEPQISLRNGIRNIVNDLSTGTN